MRHSCTTAALAAALTGCLNISGAARNEAVEAKQLPARDWNNDIHQNVERMMGEGRDIFRHDTFGSEAWFGDKLGLHEAIADPKHGGRGKGLTPKEALALGLKVDIGALPKILLRAIQETAVSLDNPETTVALLEANSVLGVKAFFREGRMTSIGITCALCHSTVDDSFATGIGRRLDGWPNRDLNVGAIVASAPRLDAFGKALGVPVEDVRKILLAWGPGRYDAEVSIDRKGFRPDGKTAATVLPPAFGLAGVNLHTYTGWGSVAYWNAYVANTQMHGQGTFFDPRLGDSKRFPAAAPQGLQDMRAQPDLVTSKLPALHFYQLSIPAPRPPKDSFDAAAAGRGKALFEGKASCARCHVPPLYTEPGWAMHTPEEIGIDAFQAERSPDKRYRTTPLRGLFVRAKGGFYHDGRFADYRAVVDHYDRHLKLSLAEGEKAELVEFLKSL